MKKNKLLIIIFSFILSFFIIHLIFKNKFEAFKEKIKKFEIDQIENFTREKEKKYDQISKEGLATFYNEYFEESKCYSELDTSFSFLYYRRKINYKKGRLDYLDCLHKKCLIESQNAIINKKISLKEKELKKKYGVTFDFWYPKLKDKNILKKIYMKGNCEEFFPELFKINYDTKTWSEFENFLKYYEKEVKDAEIQNKKAEIDYINNISSTKKLLDDDIINYFDIQLSNNKSQIITTEKEIKTFNSSELGTIKYKITKKKFNMQAFQNIADKAFEEQWKYNSLSTGSMPYSSCYGSNNYCEDWGCSQIRVITSGNEDLLVTIKNIHGKVVRHAYIQGGNTFTFNVPNGNYQVFFYSGSGWNPTKKMPSSSCNYLKGGFLSNENVSKDNYINLYNQIITYELILQENGNFSTRPSSKNEAF